MDYDDNDFQGQNLHLAGEGSSKFPPVLRPYALPKFDFDDSLQGHLRFDSLVETEVFLGIPSQEDSQWIVDFSRGSSGVEFSSSAAESCSISRRNNVWSEATSSESVEMLLKSVGQEEMVREETIIEESDAGDELGSLTKEAETNLKKGDRMEDVKDSHPALPPDEFLDNFPGLNETAGGEHLPVKSTALTQEVEPLAYGSSSQLDPNVVSEKCGLYLTKENIGIDRRCDNPSQIEVGASVNESLNNQMQEDPYVSGKQLDNVDSSSQNIIAIVGKLENQESAHHVSDICFENPSGLPIGTCKGVVEPNVQSKEVNTDDLILRENVAKTKLDSSVTVASKVESIEEHAVETSFTDFQEPSSLPLKGNDDLQVAEACNEDVCSMEFAPISKGEDVVFSKDLVVEQQFKGNIHDESRDAFQDDGSSEGHATEVSNTKAAMCATPELKVDSIMPKTHGQSCSIEEKEFVLGNDNQMGRETLVSSSEAPMLSGTDNKHFKQVDGSSINHAGDPASLMVATSPAELLGGKPATENSISGDDASEVHKDPNAEDHVSTPMLVGSVQMCKENLSSEQGDTHNSDKDVPFGDRGNAKLPTDTSNTECEIVGPLDGEGRVKTLSLGEVIREQVELARPELDTTTVNDIVLDVAAKDSKIASSDALDSGPSLSGVGATAHEVSDNNEEQKLPLPEVELVHLDKKEEVEVEIPKEASLLTLKESSTVEAELGSTSEGEKSAPHDCAEQILHKTEEHSDPMVDTFDTANQNEQAAEFSQECSEKLEVGPVLCDSTVKEDTGAGVIAIENHEETATEKDQGTRALKVSVDASNDNEISTDLAPSSECDANRMLDDGGSSVDSDKPSCGSPIVISCKEPLQSEKDREEGVNGAVIENVPLSEATGRVDSKVQSISTDLSGKDVSKEDSSFTFEVRPLAGLPEGETCKAWQSLPTIQACKISLSVEGSTSTSVGGQTAPKIAQEISCRSPQAPDGGITQGRARGTPERKTRRGGSGKTGRENVKKVNPVNETTTVRQAERGDKPGISMSVSATGQLVQFDELKRCGNVERSATKSCGVISVPTSNLPDLNTSTSPSALFQQPFTDLQQLQLRAQIFVYGSLIQGAAPDEACMVSAFGGSDGGRSAWEPAWRACVERLQGQKFHGNNSETPVQSRSGARVPDQAIKQSSLQSKALSSPAGRVSSKGAPSPVVNPIIPLSSPLWNISTPSCDGLQSSGTPKGAILDYHQTLSPLHPYQNPPMRNFVGHTSSWLSQAPFPGPWVATPQTSTFDVSSRFSALPMTETVKLTPVKESPVAISSGTKHASPVSMAHSGSPSVFAGTPSLLDMKKVTGSPGQHSTDPKARKRKKVSVGEDFGQVSLPAQTESLSAPVASSLLSKKAPVTQELGQISLVARTDSVSGPVVGGHFSTSVAVTTSACFASKGNSVTFLTPVTPTSFNDQPKKGDENVEKNVMISVETFSKVDEAKQQAEAAAAHAAAAVSRCQGVWSQLDKQKNSGLVSDVEVKLTSAAIAIEAAASVAKAAAAAAKVALNASEQAKLLADEAFAISGMGNLPQSQATTLPNVVNYLGKATPASILKGGDGSNCSSSIIVAAREAARRRVEAASAASKHAENLDAIVKAAELAAEAVSQAGKIVGMGDPLLLSELVEAGPEGYWKVPRVPCDRTVKSKNMNGDQPNINSVEVICNVSAKLTEGPSDKEMQTTNHGMPLPPRETSRDMIEDHLRVVDGLSGSVTYSEKESRGQRGRRTSELAKTIGVVPESEIGSRSTSVVCDDDHENAGGTLKENSIKEGCFVEVLKDRGDLKGAWFSANVLNLKDGKALVSYTELQSDEGLGQLKEWVPLEGEGNEAPIIRIAHPRTTMQFEGTRKRRRAAMRDYAWFVGDRVDAWMQDCWREGLVTEKNKKDETTLTVHFTAKGDTSVVRAWNLRRTLIWKDGEWSEWSSSREHCPSQGDTPQEKRLKLGTSATQGKGKDKVSKSMDLVESGKHEESTLLPLSANEKVFNFGKNSRDENQPDVLRTMRTGLQKEGSRVIFGVPKPGKKRKFMEVSKHYVSEKSSKSDVANDSVKFAKYLMPQGSVSRGWKNNSKVDPKEKRTAESKPKVLKSGNPQSVSGRTLPRKDNFLTSAVSTSTDGALTDHAVKDSISNDENQSVQQNLMGFGSFSNTEEAAEGSILFSSRAPPPDASKKVPMSNAKSERLNKGKVAHVGGKSAKVELKDKSIHEVVEPRRSNRRIQPTSRLLEGLQSSLIISKIPAVSHDKTQRSQNRGTSKGNNNHG